MVLSLHAQHRAQLVARLGLATIFAVAALPKLADPHTFAQQIANYQAIPDAYVGYMAVLLPSLELVIALALVIGPWTRGAALLSALLLAGFAIAMLQAMVRGIDLSCGCFGRLSESQIDGWQVLRNVGLAMIALWVVVKPITRPRVAARG